MKYLKYQLIILFYIGLIFLVSSCKETVNPINPLEIVIAHSPVSTERYIGSPSIAILPSGKYIASHDFFGPNSQRKVTNIYQSTDEGLTWEKLTQLDGQWWSNIFFHKNSLYIMGTSGIYGKLVIRRSNDEGKSWTTPIDSETGVLLEGSEYHTAPMPIIIHRGRIWRSMEERNPHFGWATNFLSFVISATENSDLLKASSWKKTNSIRYNKQEWLGRAWLEGNVVITPQGEIKNILRCDIESGKELAAVIDISTDGDNATFNPEKGFINFPGGSKKFTIRYDEISKKYWSLANFIPQEFEGYNPSKTRNTLALISSLDLKSWNVSKVVLQNLDVEHVGFQYADWHFEKNDIISVVRTAYPESDATNENNAHDSNYMTFIRISNFRAY